MGPKKLSAKKSIRPLEVVDEVLNVVDSRADEFVAGLKEFVEIGSSPLVSKSNWSSSKTMTVKRAADILKELGVEVEEFVGQNFQQMSSNACDVPVLLASLCRWPEKTTVLVYCQLDGSGEDPAFPSSGKYVRGRAVTEAAAFLVWIDMISAHKEANVALPCNLKFCLDAMSGREVTLLMQVMRRRLDFFESDLCLACVSQGLARNKPDIVYGFRGLCNFFFRIKKGSGPSQDPEQENQTMLDALYLMNSLKDQEGNIAVDGLNRDVDEVTEEQRIWFSSIDFNTDKLNGFFSTRGVLTHEKVTHLEKLWCCPAIVMRGIYPAQMAGAITGGFTVLTVPHQTPQVVRHRVLDHLARKWKQRDSCNTLELGMDYWTWPWRADESGLEYRVLAQAISAVYGQWPQAIMSGAHLAFPPILKKMTGKNVAIFTLGSFLDQKLTNEEKISVKDFTNGIKLVARLLHYLEKEPKAAPIARTAIKLEKAKK